MRRWMPMMPEPRGFLARLAALLLTLSLAAPAALRAELATELWFEEFEPGVGSWRSRALISEHWLRWDDGASTEVAAGDAVAGDSDSGDGHSGGDFLLFDRRTATLYNATRGDHSLLVIPRAAPLPEVPAALGLVRERLPDEVPAVGGVAVSSYRLRANGADCGGFSAAPGLLEDAAVALRDYRLAVAANNFARLGATPESLRDDCFLANNIHAVALRHGVGFPVAEWRLDDGRRRLLIDFTTAREVDAALFALPDYRRYQLPQPLQ